jgi:uncharacterized membrane protein
MTTSKFSIGDAVSFGWETMKANIFFFIGVLIVMGVAEGIPRVIGDLTVKDRPVVATIFYIISVVVNMGLSMGFIKILLKFCDGEKPKFSELFSCFHLFFKYLGAVILYALIVLGGMILLIVPGVIWAIKFQFFPYFIVESELGPIESLKRSSAITDGAKMDLFLFGLLLLGINIVGALCCLIGLFATIPITMVALAYVYRTLRAHIEAPPMPGTPEGLPAQ